MAETLFFDLDGTLTDPKQGITRSIQFALEKLGVDVPELNELTWCIGPPLLENFQILAGHDRAALAVAYYRERFSSVGLYENTPYPRIHEVLEALQAAEIRLCVASSKPLVFVTRILERFELNPYFSDVFGSELDGTRSDKSELLHYALEQTGTIASEATMIGDRKHDIIGAMNNGIAPIGVLYGYGSVEELTAAGATRLVKTPDEIPKLILEQSAGPAAQKPLNSAKSSTEARSV